MRVGQFPKKDIQTTETRMNLLESIRALNANNPGRSIQHHLPAKPVLFFDQIHHIPSILRVIGSI